MLMLSSMGQSVNALAPIAVQPSGRTTLVSFLQPLNACAPTLVSDEGSVMALMPEPANTPSPISSTESGIETSPSSPIG